MDLVVSSVYLFAIGPMFKPYDTLVFALFLSGFPLHQTPENKRSQNAQTSTNKRWSIWFGPFGLLF